MHSQPNINNKKVTSIAYMCVQNTGVGCGTCNFRNVCTT